MPLLFRHFSSLREVFFVLSLAFIWEQPLAGEETFSKWAFFFSSFFVRIRWPQWAGYCTKQLFPLQESRVALQFSMEMKTFLLTMYFIARKGQNVKFFKILPIEKTLLCLS